MITITDNAKEKLSAIFEEEERKGQGLRVTATQGMSPFSVDYGLAFVEPGEEKEDDQIIEFDGFNVHIDSESAPLLEGAVVDYVTGLNETGFKISNPKAQKPPTPSGPVAEKVQKILESKVNPGVAMHGGVISLVDVKDDIAYLRFGGGCQGCGMVDVTLKQGVEVMLKEAVPELKGVMDVTDHASGQNPYYQPAK